MSTQNVYFTAPSTISQLQNVAGTDSALLDVAGTLQNFTAYYQGGTPVTGRTILATGAAPIVGAVTAFKYCPANSGVGGDAQGLTDLGIGILVGNAFTGEEIFFATGVATSQGTGYSYDQTLMHLASTGKFLNSFVWLKALEERLFTMADTPYTMGLSDWTGAYYYYTNGTGGLMTNEVIASNVPDFTASGNPAGQVWTGARAAGNLREFTFAALASQNVAWPHDYINSPNALLGRLGWCTTGANLSGFDWALANTYRDVYNCQRVGINGGTPAAAISAGNAIWTDVVAKLCNNVVFMTGPVTDYLTTAIKCIKGGHVALGWQVNAMTGSTSYDISLSKNLYGKLNYALMSAMTAKATVRAGYSSLFNYMQTKFLIPMEIETPKDLFILNYSAPTTASDRYLVGSISRRTQTQSSGTNFVGCGLFDGGALYQAGLTYLATNGASGRPFNQQYWCDQYNDTIAKPDYTNYYGDPLGWVFGGDIVSNFKTWAKITKLFINKGVYTNSLGQQVKLLKRQTIEGSKATCAQPGSFYAQYAGVPENDYTYGRWILAQVWQYDYSMPYTDISANAADFPGTSNINMTSLPWTSGQGYNWGGSNGSNYAFNDLTGVYVLAFNAVFSNTNRAKSVGATTWLASYVQEQMDN